MGHIPHKIDRNSARGIIVAEDRACRSNRDDARLASDSDRVADMPACPKVPIGDKRGREGGLWRIGSLLKRIERITDAARRFAS
jgi:hypothetical protein